MRFSFRCLLGLHEWFSQFSNWKEQTVVTSVCLRCGELREPIIVTGKWDKRGFLTYLVKEVEKEAENGN